MVKTNRWTLHMVYNIQQSATQGSNDMTYRLSRRTAATTRFSPESKGCHKQTMPRFCQHPIRSAFTSQAFTRWCQLSTHLINRPATHLLCTINASKCAQLCGHLFPYSNIRDKSSRGAQTASGANPVGSWVPIRTLDRIISKFIGNFFVQRHICDKIFTKIWSIFPIAKKCPIYVEEYVKKILLYGSRRRWRPEFNQFYLVPKTEKTTDPKFM